VLVKILSVNDETCDAPSSSVGELETGSRNILL